MGVSITRATINGQPAARLQSAGRTMGLVALDIDQDGVRTVFWVLNSD